MTEFDWNVVVTAHAEGFTDTIREMERFGTIAGTDFFNVLVMNVQDTTAFLFAFDALLKEQPGVLNFVSRVVAAEHAFNFRNAAEFEAKVRDAATLWLQRLAGMRFHVRMHRRGFKGRLQTPVEERFLDEVLLQALEDAGTPGSIAFDDPDAILAIETVDNRAGLSLWSRLDLETRPYLGLD